MSAPAVLGNYFREHSKHLNLSQPDGLRRGQTAAIHALIGHLTLKAESAIAVLPTGAGKTDVGIVLPYALRSERVLVVVPSDSVRSQVSKRFETLSMLKKLGVIDPSIPGPSVKTLSKRLSTLDEWNALRTSDVVVTTPSSISPMLKGVLGPPEDLFDLLLIDEAHHSPAKTWQSVLEAFPKAHRALFTATPFRRDRKQLKGTIVVNYSLRDARKDEVFGDIEYRPLQLQAGEDSDTAIATAVEAALKTDRASSLDHSIMVRASSIPHAEELLEKYSQVTTLKLEVVHSKFSAKKIEKSIEKLQTRELDGVICVNMLGEGFDCPNLKIAALHAPHASLGITLQFIGRFARVGSERLGTAKFFAVPSEIEGEMAELFDAQSVWQDLIVNLSETRILQEDQLRADLATFDPPSTQEPDLEELSLYALRPKYHVKVYRVPDDLDVDVHAEVALPKPFELVHRQASDDLEAVVMIGKEQQRPRWSNQARFGRIEYDLFIVHFNRSARLLFIHSSRRATSLYRQIASEYAGQALKGLPLYMLNRSLAGLKKIECFSVGMKNRLHTARQESYRIVAGRRADLAIRKTDGKLFHQGHIYCTAQDEAGRSLLLGYSSGSKLWSGGNGTVPQLVKWSQALAAKMVSTTGVVIAPGLDILAVGVPLTTLPIDIFAVDWDPMVFEEGVEAKDGSGQEPFLLADCSVSIDRNASTSQLVRVLLEHDADRWEFDFKPNDKTFFRLVGGGDLDILYDDDTLTVTDFLNEYPLYFYCTNFAKFRGDEYFPGSSEASSFDKQTIQCIAWKTGGVEDIRREFWKPDEAANGSKSIHDFLETYLNVSKHEIVLYDHRSGEVADFLTVESDDQSVRMTVYHCKGSSKSFAGDRVDDVYEVCGQVVKSLHLLSDEKRLLKHVKRRTTKTKILSRYVKGTTAELERIVRERSGKRLVYRFVVVQPGISKANIGDPCLTVLAAANEFIHSLGAEELIVMGSD